MEITLKDSPRASRLVESVRFNEQITYTFDTESGLLKIGGQGEVNHTPNNCLIMDRDIKGIEIAEGITHIGECAFSELETLSFVSLSQSVKCIGHLSFFACEKLTSLTLPKNVTAIDHEAFMLCTRLRVVKCEAIVPPIIEYDTFVGVPCEKGTLYVPKESVDAYKTNPSWGAWGSILPLEDDMNINKKLREQYT